MVDHSSWLTSVKLLMLFPYMITYGSSLMLIPDAMWRGNRLTIHSNLTQNVGSQQPQISDGWMDRQTHGHHFNRILREGLGPKYQIVSQKLEKSEMISTKNASVMCLSDRCR
jgi:hypothetical protein